MKTELNEVSETRKTLTFEVDPERLDGEIDRVAKGYARQARIPGFRQGKVPVNVVKQRYKDQILYDVAHDLIPRLVGDALKARDLRPVATPDIREVVLEEGRPLTFIADFETMPPIEPGNYVGLSVRRQPAVLEVGAVDRALEQLQQRAARWQPVEDRPAASGDTLLLAIAGPVIAGTSLFGGRGFVWSALLGAIVIGSIANGMDLLALDSDIKFMITGAVLLLAVTIDAITRRQRESSR